MRTQSFILETTANACLLYNLHLAILTTNTSQEKGRYKAKQPTYLRKLDPSHLAQSPNPYDLSKSSTMAAITTQVSPGTFGTMTDLTMRILQQAEVLLQSINLPHRDFLGTTETLHVNITRLPQQRQEELRTNNTSSSGAAAAPPVVQYTAIVTVLVISPPQYDGDIWREYRRGFIQGRASESIQGALEMLVESTCEMMHGYFRDMRWYPRLQPGAMELKGSGGLFWDGTPG